MVSGEEYAWKGLRSLGPDRMEYECTVLGEKFTVTTFRRTKTTWGASGTFKGNLMVETGRSEKAARRSWYTAAYYKLDF
jgi:hypothetical protein